MGEADEGAEGDAGRQGAGRLGQSSQRGKNFCR